MKRFHFFCFFLILWSCLSVEASDQTKISYEIYYDSNQHNEAIVLQYVLDTYHQLVEEVSRKSQSRLIRNQLYLFQYDETTEVRFESDTLVLILGDGKGTCIDGTFRTIECIPEIERTSWIFEKLGIQK